MIYFWVSRGVSYKWSHLTKEEISARWVCHTVISVDAGNWKCWTSKSLTENINSANDSVSLNSITLSFGSVERILKFVYRLYFCIVSVFLYCLCIIVLCLYFCIVFVFLYCVCIFVLCLYICIVFVFLYCVCIFVLCLYIYSQYTMN